MSTGVLIATLPFPAQLTTGSVCDFLRDRYKLALALLCVQHHIFHLTSAFEEVRWPTELLREPDNGVHLMTGGGNSPMPSDSPAEVYPLLEDVELLIDDDSCVPDAMSAHVEVQSEVANWLKDSE